MPISSKITGESATVISVSNDAKHELRDKLIRELKAVFGEEKSESAVAVKTIYPHIFLGYPRSVPSATAAADNNSVVEQPMPQLRLDEKDFVENKSNRDVLQRKITTWLTAMDSGGFLTGKKTEQNKEIVEKIINGIFPSLSASSDVKNKSSSVVTDSNVVITQSAVKANTSKALVKAFNQYIGDKKSLKNIDIGYLSSLIEKELGKDEKKKNQREGYLAFLGAALSLQGNKGEDGKREAENALKKLRLKGVDYQLLPKSTEEEGGLNLARAQLLTLILADAKDLKIAGNENLISIIRSKGNQTENDASLMFRICRELGMTPDAMAKETNKGKSVEEVITEKFNPPVSKPDESMRVEVLTAPASDRFTAILKDSKHTAVQVATQMVQAYGKGKTNLLIDGYKNLTNLIGDAKNTLLHDLVAGSKNEILGNARQHVLSFRDEFLRFSGIQGRLDEDAQQAAAEVRVACEQALVHLEKTIDAIDSLLLVERDLQAAIIQGEMLFKDGMFKPGLASNNILEAERLLSTVIGRVDSVVGHLDGIEIESVSVLKDNALNLMHLIRHQFDEDNKKADALRQEYQSLISKIADVNESVLVVQDSSLINDELQRIEKSAQKFTDKNNELSRLKGKLSLTQESALVLDELAMDSKRGLTGLADSVTKTEQVIPIIGSLFLAVHQAKKLTASSWYRSQEGKSDAEQMLKKLSVAINPIEMGSFTTGGSFFDASAVNALVTTAKELIKTIGEGLSLSAEATRRAAQKNNADSYIAAFLATTKEINSTQVRDGVSKANELDRLTRSHKDFSEDISLLRGTVEESEIQSSGLDQARAGAQSALDALSARISDLSIVVSQEADEKAKQITQDQAALFAKHAGEINNIIKQVHELDDSSIVTRAGLSVALKTYATLQSQWARLKKNLFADKADNKVNPGQWLQLEDLGNAADSSFIAGHTSVTKKQEALLAEEEKRQEEIKQAEEARRVAAELAIRLGEEKAAAELARKREEERTTEEIRRVGVLERDLAVEFGVKDQTKNTAQQRVNARQAEFARLDGEFKQLSAEIKPAENKLLAARGEFEKADAEAKRLRTALAAQQQAVLSANAEVGAARNAENAADLKAVADQKAADQLRFAAQVKTAMEKKTDIVPAEKVTFYADKAVLIPQKYSAQVLEKALGNYCHGEKAYKFSFEEEKFATDKKHKQTRISQMKSHDVAIYATGDPPSGLKYVIKNTANDLEEGTITKGDGKGQLSAAHFDSILARFPPDSLVPPLNEAGIEAFVKMANELAVVHQSADNSLEAISRATVVLSPQEEKAMIKFKLTDPLQGENSCRLNFLPLHAFSGAARRPAEDEVAVFVERLVKDKNDQEILVSELVRLPTSLTLVGMVGQEAYNYSKISQIGVLLQLFDSWRNNSYAHRVDRRKVTVESLKEFLEAAKKDRGFLAKMCPEGQADALNEELQKFFKQDNGMWALSAKRLVHGSLSGLAEKIYTTYREKTLGSNGLPADSYIALACAELHGFDAMTRVEIDNGTTDDFSRGHTFQNVKDETHLFALKLEAARINLHRAEAGLPQILFADKSGYDISTINSLASALVKPIQDSKAYNSQIAKYAEYLVTPTYTQKFKKWRDSSSPDHLQRVDSRLKSDKWKPESKDSKDARQGALKPGSAAALTAQADAAAQVALASKQAAEDSIQALEAAEERANKLAANAVVSAEAALESAEVILRRADIAFRLAESNLKDAKTAAANAEQQLSDANTQLVAASAAAVPQPVVVIAPEPELAVVLPPPATAFIPDSASVSIPPSPSNNAESAIISPSVSFGLDPGADDLTPPSESKYGPPLEDLAAAAAPLSASSSPSFVPVKQTVENYEVEDYKNLISKQKEAVDLGMKKFDASLLAHKSEAKSLEKTAALKLAKEALLGSIKEYIATLAGEKIPLISIEEQGERIRKALEGQPPSAEEQARSLAALAAFEKERAVLFENEQARLTTYFLANKFSNEDIELSSVPFDSGKIVNRNARAYEEGIKKQKLAIEKYEAVLLIAQKESPSTNDTLSALFLADMSRQAAKTEVASLKKNLIAAANRCIADFQDDLDKASVDFSLSDTGENHAEMEEARQRLEQTRSNLAKSFIEFGFNKDDLIASGIWFPETFSAIAPVEAKMAAYKIQDAGGMHKDDPALKVDLILAVDNCMRALRRNVLNATAFHPQASKEDQTKYNRAFIIYEQVQDMLSSHFIRLGFNADSFAKDELGQQLRLVFRFIQTPDSLNFQATAPVDPVPIASSSAPARLASVFTVSSRESKVNEANSQSAVGAEPHTKMRVFRGELPSQRAARLAAAKESVSHDKKEPVASSGNARTRKGGP